MDICNIKGIICYDVPLITNFYEFAFQHLNCDSIALKDSLKDPKSTAIIAYATSMDYNLALRKLFEKKYQGGKYIIMRHISDKEVDAIV